MLQRHFRTLEIKPTTDKKVIKNAYRKLAKKYHPDISKVPDAHERFVEITLAYEKILERLDRPAPRVNRQSTQTKRQQYRDHIRKQQRRRRDPRKRAERYAKMNYSQFEEAQPKPPPFHGRIESFLDFAHLCFYTRYSIAFTLGKL
ncbi:DnaJ domain-containing protein [bacterium SCSIO 12741]|nr:DnaJ domain-containing protein [bacterium SCSIO 12741]